MCQVEYPMSKSFSHICESSLALAELSIMSEEIATQALTENGLKCPNNNVWYWFSRLNVPVKMRNRGIATQLMEQLTEWADSMQVNILNGVNASGSMDKESLILFYEKYSFVRISSDEMVRYPKR